MGKFKFSKRAYVDKIKDQRDWERGKEEDTWHGDLNEKRNCIRFVSLDRFQKATLAVAGDSKPEVVRIVGDLRLVEHRPREHRLARWNEECLVNISKRKASSLRVAGRISQFRIEPDSLIPQAHGSGRIVVERDGVIPCEPATFACDIRVGRDGVGFHVGTSNRSRVSTPALRIRIVGAESY